MVRGTPTGSISDVAKQSIYERIKAMDYSQFLLFGILAAIIVGIPWGVAEIKGFAKEQRSEFREDKVETDKRFIAERVETETRHAAERKADREAHARQLEMITETYRESVGLIGKKRELPAANNQLGLPGTE